MFARGGIAAVGAVALLASVAWADPPTFRTDFASAETLTLGLSGGAETTAVHWRSRGYYGYRPSFYYGYRPSYYYGYRPFYAPSYSYYAPRGFSLGFGYNYYQPYRFSSYYYAPPAYYYSAPVYSYSCPIVLPRISAGISVTPPPVEFGPAPRVVPQPAQPVLPGNPGAPPAIPRLEDPSGETFPYDGGPALPVPGPQNGPSAPIGAPRPTVPDRIVSVPKSPTKYQYAAYGEEARPASVPRERTLTVKQEAKPERR